jgi:hypothetical protein
MAEVDAAYRIAVQIVLTDVFKKGMISNRDEDGDGDKLPETSTQIYVREMVAGSVAAAVAKKL